MSGPVSPQIYWASNGRTEYPTLKYYNAASLKEYMLTSCVPNYGGLAMWSAWMTADFQKRCSTGSSSQGSVLQTIQ